MNFSLALDAALEYQNLKKVLSANEYAANKKKPDRKFTLNKQIEAYKDIDLRMGELMNINVLEEEFKNLFSRFQKEQVEPEKFLVV